MSITEKPLVSTDDRRPRSSAVDGLLTMANGSSVKLVAWYDNEWAYACRLVELAERVGATLPTLEGAAR